MPETHDDPREPQQYKGENPRHYRLIGISIIIVLLLAYWAHIGTDGLVFMMHFALPLLVPTVLALAINWILLGFIFKGFWRRWIELLILLILWMGYTTVLVAWLYGITSSDAFQAVRSAHSDDLWSRNRPVIDAQFQQEFMTIFWYASGSLLCAAVVVTMTRAFVQHFRCRECQHGLGWRISALLLSAFMLVRILGDFRESERLSGLILADSISPDHKCQIRLAPISMLADLNGVVMTRKGDTLWWRPIDTVGDTLGSTRDVRFAWDSGSQVTLLIGGEPWCTYDLLAGRKFYRPLERPSQATRPTAEPTSGMQPNP